MISAERVEQGRWIYSAWKHLKQYTAVDTAAAFEATILTGKMGDLLGRMRRLAAYPVTALEPLARDARIPKRELLQVVIPAFESLGIFRVERQGQEVRQVQAFVLSQDDVMDQIARIWAHLAPEPDERGSLSLLRVTATMPVTREEALAALVKESLTEEQAAHALELALAHELVRERHVAEHNSDFVFNDFLWGENIDRTTDALAVLPSNIREGLRSLLAELHQHEGRPLAEIQSASPDLVRLAVAHGLVEATQITTADGKQATFHFTPRFRGFGVSRNEIPDVLDQVKLVISSFAFSTRYARYRLRDPDVFLDRLIERGNAGNASPIGTDYGAMEKQKIVNVEPVAPGAARFRFRVVKKDALVEARDTVRSGALLLPSPRGSGANFLREPQSFIDPVATRGAQEGPASARGLTQSS